MLIAKNFWVNAASPITHVQIHLRNFELQLNYSEI